MRPSKKEIFQKEAIILSCENKYKTIEDLLEEVHINVFNKHGLTMNKSYLRTKIREIGFNILSYNELIKDLEKMNSEELYSFLLYGNDNRVKMYKEIVLYILRNRKEKDLIEKLKDQNILTA